MRLGLLGCLFAATVYAAVARPIADPAVFLDRAESLRKADHPQFVRMLAQIQPQASQLAGAQQWHLRYLDAWEAMYEGDYAGSAAQFRDIVDHSGDAVLAAKSEALLLSNLANTKHYEEAFLLADRLGSEWPRIRDPTARYLVLFNLSQMLDLAGQADLAIQYARLAGQNLPPGQNACESLSLEVAALFASRRLASSAPIFSRAVDACVAARKTVFADTVWLTLGSVYLLEKQPAKVLALLDRITPELRMSRYAPSLLAGKVMRAQAYAALGRDDEAVKAALAVVAEADPGALDDALKDAYEVLYRIEEKQGHPAAALAYYQRYVAQDKGYLDDIRARALAYATVQQHVLAEKLETEQLSRQNDILRLQQALATKEVEAGRLYIALLLLALASGFFWLLRLWRSQRRFKDLSRLDGLTGIHNRQHFMDEAGRVLRRLEKLGGEACLIFIDLDHFKQINDTHGHPTGDAVLTRTVEVCRQQLRPTDLFGRLGGEEFAVLLPACSREQGMAVAKRMRFAIEDAPVAVESGHVVFSASIGMACADRAGYDLQPLCRQADAALYRAKRGGRNRVIVDSEDDEPLVV